MTDKSEGIRKSTGLILGSYGLSCRVIFWLRVDVSEKQIGPTLRNEYGGSTLGREMRVVRMMTSSIRIPHSVALPARNSPCTLMPWADNHVVIHLK